jgi:hypothetical protein
MFKSLKLWTLLTLLILMVGSAMAQTQRERPYPNPIPVPPNYLQAIENGTRSVDGTPGPNYWQQWSEYDIKATLHPDKNLVEGVVKIVYYNNSPDTLRMLHLDLDLNVHKEGAMRNEPGEVTQAVTIKRVAAAGSEAVEGSRQGARFMINGTRMVVVPQQTVAPGANVEMEVHWTLDIPQAGAGGRMGYDSGNVFFLAYWYPRMAVYDDLQGWHPDPFLSRAEFYHGFGNYAIEITAPGNWVVMSTGEFLNPSEVLAPHVLERYNKAGESDEVVNIVTKDDFGSVATTGTDSGMLTWKFYAKDVRDIAFSATRESFWDGGRTPVGDKDGDSKVDYIRANAFWREVAPNWSQAAAYVQSSIEFLSRYTDFSYPWPHMTSVEAGNIIGGGMEFPMMTIIGNYNRAGADALYSVTMHELAHMWIPLIVSSDERRYSWFDEGYTSFQTNAGNAEYRPESDSYMGSREGYIRFAKFGREGEMMRWSDSHDNGSSFGVASYAKPAAILAALRGVLGEETFMKVHHELFRQWNFKLMSPFDWFSFVDSVSGQDLSWFWRSWYFETWTMDHAIEAVTETEEGFTVNVRDNGDAIMPVHLKVTFEDGSSHTHKTGVQDWIDGERNMMINLRRKDIKSIEIDGDRNFPDTDRSNNSWTKGS